MSPRFRVASLVAFTSWKTPLDVFLEMPSDSKNYLGFVMNEFSELAHIIVQNFAARIVLGLRKYDHISEGVTSLAKRQAKIYGQ